MVAALAAAAAFAALFAGVEHRTANPLVPPGIFRSSSFRGANLLTLLLYFALGGAFFFLPFLLIQVQGFSATATGAAFLPFTVLVGGLSRWSGSLFDRYGARLPLIVGALAVGFFQAQLEPRLEAASLPAAERKALMGESSRLAGLKERVAEPVRGAGGDGKAGDNGAISAADRAPSPALAAIDGAFIATFRRLMLIATIFAVASAAVAALMLRRKELGDVQQV